MKISFNETSLQTMFEYPSESSLAEEEEEEEEEGHASETEEDKSCTFYIPCPNSTLHPSTPNSGERGTDGTMGLMMVSDAVQFSCRPLWGSYRWKCCQLLVELGLDGDET